jgi:hypothetical protein
MFRLPPFQLFLLIAQTAILLVLVARLWWTGLHRTYSYFFVYLLLVLFQIAALAVVPFDSKFYRYFWVASEALIVCFYALIVLELYSIVLRDLAGIASLARRYIQAGIAVAILISMLLLAFEKTPQGPVSATLIFERAIASSLVIFVLLITAFLLYYPVPLHRNVIVYSIGYSVYFLLKAAARFIENYSHRWYAEVSTLIVGVSTVCLLFWMAGLTRAGERKTLVLGHRWDPADEERLLSQLKAINASLMRSARK